MRKIILLAIIILLLPISYANIEIISAQMTEPADGKVSGKMYFQAKAVIKNTGINDIQTPFAVYTYINEKQYSSCSGKCSLRLLDDPQSTSVQLGMGLKAGQAVEDSFAMSATDREYLHLGRNTIRFMITGAQGTDDKLVREVDFVLDEGGLPSVDLTVTGLEIKTDPNGIDLIRAIITNNGPNVLKNDVIQMIATVRSRDDNSMQTSVGNFIDLRSGYCDSTQTKCEMHEGDSNTWTYSDFSSINPRLNPGMYTLTVTIDDVNGLLNYEDTNSGNNELTKTITIGKVIPIQDKKVSDVSVTIQERTTVRTGYESINGIFEQISFKLHKGWNLVPGFLDPAMIIDGDISPKDIRGVYLLDPVNQEYIRYFPEPEKAKLDTIDIATDSIATHYSQWIYSNKEGSMRYNHLLTTMPNDQMFTTVRALFPGWNLISVGDFMIGKELDEFKGDCEILKTYTWMMDKGWQEGIIRSKGAGVAIKVTERCIMKAQESVTPPPQLPN